MMDQFSDTELNRSELMQKILNEAEDRDIEPTIIRKMIVDRLKAKGLSDRSITNAIPDELKDKKMQQVKSHRLEYVRKEDTDINQDVDQPVYREPDLVAPVLGDKTLTQVPEDKTMLSEQSFTTADNYHRMNVPVPETIVTVIHS